MQIMEAMGQTARLSNGLRAAMREADLQRARELAVQFTSAARKGIKLIEEP
jgi:hypothetical protein